MSVEQTLNVTVAQIEDALLAGQTVPDFAREWSEPPANVLAVFRRLQGEGRIPRNAPSQVTTTATDKPPVASGRPAASVPESTVSAPSVDALVSAAARSSSKRTQALGVRLSDLAAVVRERLAAEREAAEKAEQQKAQRDAAAAEVARLEEQLRAAKAKLRPVRQGGGSPVQREEPASALTCGKGCGKTFTRPTWKSKHEAKCRGAAS